MEHDTYQQMARVQVFNYVKAHLDKTDTHVAFGPDDVYVVWFAKVLLNWKALVSTTLPDGMYYEVTCNGGAGKIYLDVYKKFDNATIRLDENVLEPVNLSSIDVPLTMNTSSGKVTIGTANVTPEGEALRVKADIQPKYKSLFGNDFSHVSLGMPLPAGPIQDRPLDSFDHDVSPSLERYMTADETQPDVDK